MKSWHEEEEECIEQTEEDVTLRDLMGKKRGHLVRSQKSLKALPSESEQRRVCAVTSSQWSNFPPTCLQRDFMKLFSGAIKVQA